MTDIARALHSLYDKDTSAAYQSLQALEALSETDSALYAFTDEFIAMLDSDRYVVRVRGFRLLCKQARWDSQGKLDNVIGRMLDMATRDEKPTAVRQALKALEDVVPYNKALCGRIQDAVQEIDYSRFRDTMHPLIRKDADRLLKLIDSQ